MFGFTRSLLPGLLLLGLAGTLTAPQAVASAPRPAAAPAQETGFLNRKIVLHGTTYRFQVYLPEEYRRDDRKSWPIVLFLHGRGERGAEGMWQTQVGLPQAVRDHPERWPFIFVLPQCPLGSFWTDAAMLQMAMATLDHESAEFHADPQRTYLAGLSMGGYGAWELARLNPHRWAAIAIASGGIFWSYAPERWQQAATLPAEYARALGKTPIWLFHGTEDTTVNPRQSELMYEAFKANNGHIRLWLYQGLRHDSWTRAFNEPELPRWLLAHHTESKPGGKTEQTAFAERLIVPLHPPAIRLSAAQIEALEGEYGDAAGRSGTTIFRQGEQLYERNQFGDVFELAAESANTLFYPNGSSISRITVERNAQGRIVALILRDDRHEERWEKKSGSPNR
jgi:predicted esterase